MPLDHYVSQTHLKKFYAPDLGSRMHAFRKSDSKYFTPDSKSVCAIEDGSTNAYLREDRAIEEFLKDVEPNYNAAVDACAAGKIDRQTVFTIAGFTAYVAACSPTAIRVHTAPLKGILETTAFKMDEMGMFGKPPEVLGGDSLTELLQSGKVSFSVDPKYPQAHGITGVEETTSTFGNFHWEILHNGHSPFFTSDFPATIEIGREAGSMNRLVPLAPQLAVRIVAERARRPAKPNFDFPNFDFESREISRQECISINTSIVRCAEDLVFSCQNERWVAAFLKKNRRYRIEPDITNIQDGHRTLQIATQKVIESRDASKGASQNETNRVAG